MFQSASISPLGAVSRLAKAWTGDRFLQVLDPEDETGFMLVTQGEFLSWGGSVSTWSPDGRFLIHGTYQHERGFLIVDTSSRTPRKRAGHARLYRDIQWGPTGEFVASTSWEPQGRQRYRYRLDLMRSRWYRNRSGSENPYPARGFESEPGPSLRLIERTGRTQSVPSPHRARNYGYGPLCFHPSGDRLAVVRSELTENTGAQSASRNTPSATRRDFVELLACPNLKSVGHLGPIRGRVADLGWTGRNRLVVCRSNHPPLLFELPGVRSRGVRINVLASCFAAHPRLNLGAFAGRLPHPLTPEHEQESVCLIYDFDRDKILSRCYHEGNIETLRWIRPGNRLYALSSAGSLISHRWDVRQYL